MRGVAAGVLTGVTYHWLDATRLFAAFAMACGITFCVVYGLGLLLRKAGRL